MKRISTKRKKEMIKDRSAYVSKCDGGYVFYYNEGRSFVKISKRLYKELDYLAWENGHVDTIYLQSIEKNK